MENRLEILKKLLGFDFKKFIQEDKFDEIIALFKEILETTINNNYLISFILIFRLDKNEWLYENNILPYITPSNKENINDAITKDQEMIREKNIKYSLRDIVFTMSSKRCSFILSKEASERGGIFIPLICINQENSSNELCELLEINDNKVNEVKESIRIFFEHLKSNEFFVKDWKYIYYLVSPIKRERAVSGLSIFKKELIDNETLEWLFLLLSYPFLQIDIQLLEKNERIHALRSAVAAIMARNMSHIHGSHIEPGLQHKICTFEELLFEKLF